jgi:hypothetical protein
MASAIEDVRRLARGHVLVAAMCSRLSQLVHGLGATIAHSGCGHIDKCQPLCDEEHGLEYDGQMPVRWNFGLSQDCSQSQAADRGKQPPLVAGSESSPPFLGTERASQTATDSELIEGTGTGTWQLEAPVPLWHRASGSRCSMPCQWRPAPAVSLEYFHFGKRIAVGILRACRVTLTGSRLGSAEARRPLQTGPAYKSERI